MSEVQCLQMPEQICTTAYPQGDGYTNTEMETRSMCLHFSTQYSTSNPSSSIGSRRSRSDNASKQTQRSSRIANPLHRRMGGVCCLPNSAVAAEACQHHHRCP